MLKVNCTDSECSIYINATEDKEPYVVQCGFCYHTNHHSLVPKDICFKMLLLLTVDKFF